MLASIQHNSMSSKTLLDLAFERSFDGTDLEQIASELGGKEQYRSRMHRGMMATGIVHRAMHQVNAYLITCARVVDLYM